MEKQVEIYFTSGDSLTVSLADWMAVVEKMSTAGVNSFQSFFNGEQFIRTINIQTITYVEAVEPKTIGVVEPTK